MSGHPAVHQIQCSSRLNTLSLDLGGVIALLAAVQVYVYYELGKYYQNHKRYVRSRDDNQMAGKSSGAGSGGYPCSPQDTPENSTQSTGVCAQDNQCSKTSICRDLRDAY